MVIIGGGLVGLALARALEASGLSLALIEPQPPAPPPGAGWDSRVYALSPGSAAFLEACGAWQRLAPERIARIERMRIYGDDPGARLEFSAYDAGLRELAFIVENRRLQHALLEAARGQDLSVHCPAGWTALEYHDDRVTVRLDDGAELTARLLIGADGAESRVRAHAGIAVRASDYRQLGVVANFECERPHQDVAFQWFMRDGVLALLPLPGNRVSMVWSVAEERGRRLLAAAKPALASEVEAASGGVLGALKVVTPAAGFPLKLQRVTQFTRPRLALVGDAAHNVHPLAGQGVNLGFRDARVLAGVLKDRGPQADCGDHLLLRRYERARKEDVLAMQVATDGLQKLFNNEGVLLGRVRNLGLTLVDRQPWLKSFLVHRAVA
ncbi:MAG TPA: UbiH/UbiF family hydroxylase [Burkholderiales bacterium]|nr:UbiH/UbiF family hydroxylase [Burkholderiales bacterium]